MLYACEGTKARVDKRYNRLIYSIELTNSDVNIIRIFSLFLRDVIKADWKRVRGQLFFYEDLNEQALKNLWSTVSIIPINQFQKSILLKSNPRFKPNPNGTFKIRYSCKTDYLKLEEMINEVWRDRIVA